MKQGDIYIVSLDPIVGSEQGKTRPCIIISSDLVNDYANTVTVAPLSSTIRKKKLLFHVPLSTGVIKLEQLRTVDKSRLIKHKGRVAKPIVDKIQTLLQIYFS